MAISGASLKELIEENHLTGVSFNGVVHIGNAGFIQNGDFTFPEEFNFTTEFSSTVSKAMKFGAKYLITTDCRTNSFTFDEVGKAVINGAWNIVLVF